ncbi:MAG TPA: hypothetical protein VKB18_08695 [Gemmatimonadota bacterium]|nr:hypothetical protein [Gemmatimonadota bacterium]
MTRDETRGARGERDGGSGPAGLRAVNAILFGAAVVVIVLGYILLDHGSITAAPILLVLGYVVLIPAGLLVGYRRADGEES